LPRQECLARALKRNALARGLNTVIPAEIIEALEQELAGYEERASLLGFAQKAGRLFQARLVARGPSRKRGPSWY